MRSAAANCSLSVRCCLCPKGFPLGPLPQRPTAILPKATRTTPPFGTDRSMRFEVLLVSMLDRLSCEDPRTTLSLAPNG
jgi:hypothetical protein